MKKYLLYIITFLFVFPSLLAQTGLTNFTDVQIGEKLRTLGSEAYDFRLYVFLNDGSCAQCMPILKQIEEKFSSRFKMQSIMFFNSENDIQMKVFKDAFPNYKFIQDPVGAYMDLYKIKVAPMIAILDNEGTVLFLGCPNSANNFDSQKLVTVFNSVKPETLALSDLKQIYEKELKDTNGANLSFPSYSYTYLEDENKYLIIESQKFNIYILDSAFKVLDSIYFNHEGTNIYSLYLTKGYNSSKKIGFSAECKGYSKKYYYYYSERKKFEEVFTIPPEEKITTWFNNYASSDTLILVASSLLTNSYKYNRDSLPFAVRIFNTNTKKFSNFGMFSKTSWESPLMRYYHTPIIFCDTKGRVYSLESITDTMYIYNTSGELQNTYRLYYDSSTYRIHTLEYIRNMPAKFGVTQLEESGKYISLLDEIREDKANNKIYLEFYNEGVNSSGNFTKEYYLHEIDPENGKAIGKDIKLPGLAVPISIYNNIITTFENSGDKMIFKKFEIVR